MSRLSDRRRRETEESLTENLIGREDADVRINVVMRRSLLDWLDKAIANYNRTHPRTTNRSEVFRTLVAELQADEQGLDGLL